MIEIENNTKIFGKGEAAFTALDDVSITIADNEFFTLLGPSGCGKTTLLRLIAGFEPPTIGTIRLGGRDISRLAPDKRPVNTVFQSYALFPHMSVAQNIAFGLEMLRKPKAEVVSTTDEMLRLVQMEELRDRRISEISGGQQQRVALARALAPHPQVLLLDEPLSALDLKLRKEMQLELKRLQNETGITFVFVTHDQEEALTMSDRIAVMSAGKILQIGTPREIYDRPAERFVANFVGESNFLDADLKDGTVTLSGGSRFVVDVPEGVANGRVNVLVRPEHTSVRAGEAGEGELAATVDTVVYSGEATTVLLRLANGTLLKSRRSNAPLSSNDLPDKGNPVAVTIAPGAITVLRDLMMPDTAYAPGELEAEAVAADTRRRWLLSLPAILLIVFAAAGPLLVMVLYSFLAPGDYGNVKWEFSLQGWMNTVVQRDIFDDTLMLADAHLSIFWRSLSLSLITTVLTLLIGLPTAWFIATRPPGKREFWLYLITVPFWANLLVRTIAIQELIRSEGVINLILLKIGLIEAPIQMMFTNFAIGFGMTYVYLPLMVLPIYASVDKLDFRLVEAAHDLYASRWIGFRRVILPLIKPGIIAGSILVFIPSLGAYVIPRVLGGGKNLMFGNLIELQFGQGRNWPLGAALSLMLMAAVMVSLIWYVRVTSKEQADG